LGLAASSSGRARSSKEPTPPEEKDQSDQDPIEQKESFAAGDLKQSSTFVVRPPRAYRRPGEATSTNVRAAKKQGPLSGPHLGRSRGRRRRHDDSKKIEREPIRGTHESKFRSRAHLRSQGAGAALSDDRSPADRQGEAYPPLPDSPVRHERAAGGRNRSLETLTDLPVDDLPRRSRSSIWYAQRWRSKRFHKVLEIGCKVEESKLRTAERLTI